LNLKDVMLIGNQVKVSPVELDEAKQIRLTHQYPGLRYLATAKQLTVPAPKDKAGEFLQDKDLIDWTWVFLSSVFTSPQPK